MVNDIDREILEKLERIEQLLKSIDKKLSRTSIGFFDIDFAPPLPYKPKDDGLVDPDYTITCGDFHRVGQRYINPKCLTGPIEAFRGTCSFEMTEQLEEILREFASDLEESEDDDDK